MYSKLTIVVRCAIWHHLHNLKNVKNTHGGVLTLVTLLHGCFSRFLNCTNDTKSRNAPQLRHDINIQDFHGDFEDLSYR